MINEYKYSFKEFEAQSAKNVDTWTEKLFCDKPAVALSYILYNNFKICRNQFFPYIVTLISFVFRLLTAVFFISGMYFEGAMAFFISMLSDSMDGMFSRAIFGKDPEIRGTLDVTLDWIGLSVILVSLAYVFYKSDFTIGLALLVIYAIFIYHYEFAIATKYRVSLRYNLSRDSSVLDSHLFDKNSGTPPIIKIYQKLNNFFGKRGFFFYPTMVESEFMLFVVAPIVGFSVTSISMAVLFMAIDAILTSLPVIMILMKTKEHGLSGLQK